MIKKCLLLSFILQIVIFLLILFPLSIQAAQLRKCFNAAIKKDTTCFIWVVFTDKNDSHKNINFSPHALARRSKAGFVSMTLSDIPISMHYIKEVEKMGARCNHVFKWANAASFFIRASTLVILAQQRYVKDIIPVRSFRSTVQGRYNKFPLQKLLLFDSAGMYGLSYPQLDMVSVPASHDYIVNTMKKAPGEGVIIGLFDSGFWLQHQCFDYIKVHNAVIADSDFVENDGDVADSDSLRQQYQALYFTPPEAHGSWTLSLIGGYDPPRFTGVAWGAQFVLAKTEWADRIINNKVVDIELHSEEDNWASALVWAESLGVDIVSSSLGYRSDFTDSMGNPAPSEDYTLSEMNGQKTIISIAAQQAVARGMIIVNSMGNEGTAATSLDAPADVEDVVSVGGINGDKNITSFSSRGPTADNRIKPDCVAQATDIFLPDIYSLSAASYINGMAGTSFAAPVVSGIGALIRQTHPSDSANILRQRLYASCFFVPHQNSIDNTYGRGIPDALLACLDYRQSYLRIVNSENMPLAGAVVVRLNNQTESWISDSMGIAIINSGQLLPDTVIVTRQSYLTDSIVISNRHTRNYVNLLSQYWLSIVLKDSLGAPVVGTVYWKENNSSNYLSIRTDSLGMVKIPQISSSTVMLYGMANGYFRSDEMTVDLSKGVRLTIIILKSRPVMQCILYPTVLDIVKKKQFLTCEFIAAEDDPRTYSQLLRVSIRSFNGSLIWSHVAYCTQLKPVVLRWPESETKIAPGMYYFIITYAGKTYKKKFLILG